MLNFTEIYFLIFLIKIVIFENFSSAASRDKSIKIWQVETGYENLC